MTISIRQIGIFVILATILTGVTFIGTAAFVYTRISEADEVWHRYRDDTSAKARAVDELVTNMGFGGMIHQFKNYVLRKDLPRIRKVQDAAGGAFSALHAYETTVLTGAEREALEKIRGVVNEYAENVLVAQNLAEEGATARQIDQAVKISDGPALEGIATLIEAIQADRDNLQEATKTELLAEIRAAMGFGGMIHQFKNYVLRQDEPRIEKIKAKARAAESAIAQYRGKGVTEKESAALDAIQGVIQAYVTNTDKVQGLAQQDSTPESIDKVVKISDGPALEGLGVLVSEIALAANQERNRLSSTFVTVSAVSLLVMIIAVLATVIVSTLVYLGVRHKILMPISTLVAALTRLSKGDTAVDVSHLKADTEVGEMARTMDVFRQNLVDNTALHAEQEDSRHASEEHTHRLEDLTSRFDHGIGSILQGLASAAEELHASAESMAAIADRSANHANAVDQAAGEATRNVEGAAASADELSASINEIGRQAAQSSSISTNSEDQAHKAQQTVSDLATSVDRIGEVVHLITDVADQTNLLALNATIEAARAGEAGKGFAVVAGEVKNLANQTGRATDEIALQIKSVQEETSAAVKAINAIVSGAAEAKGVASSIAAAVDQQNAATQSIADGVGEAASRTRDVSERIHGVLEVAGETEAASNQVLEASTEMARQAETLKGMVEQYLADVRQA